MDSKSISVPVHEEDQEDDEQEGELLDEEANQTLLDWTLRGRRGSEMAKSEVRPEMKRTKGQRRIDVPMRSFNVGE